MGPTNVALVKLFRADQALREAQERLDAATKNVRVQDRRVTDLTEKLRLAQVKHRELQVKSGNLDLDLKTRDAHIEKLRTQQQTAHNNKEYQTFLVEINTQKVDKAKVEETAMVVMQDVETAGKESVGFSTGLESEKAKLVQLKSQIGGEIIKLEAEIESLKGPRNELSATLPPKARIAFDKLADHHDGEALSALLKPDRRREEYVCSACMMDLVTDVYNKLHTRDDMVFCPSCRRILYVPDELPPEMAVNKKKATTGSLSNAGASAGETERPKEAPRAKGKLGDLLTKSQGESVKNAVAGGYNPQEFHVTVDGKVVGIYKGQNAENLERTIRFNLEEKGLKHEVHVNLVVQEKPAATAAMDAPPAAVETPSVEATPVAVAESETSSV